MRFVPGLVLAMLLAANAQAAPKVDIGFCPSGRVHTYPADERNRVQSLLLQNVAITNRGDAPVDVRAIQIALLRHGEATDTRTLSAAEVARYADAGRYMQKGGMLADAAFQFCGTSLIDAKTKLGGPTLAPGEALLVMQQAFVFNGARDTLRVTAETSRGDSVATIPIVATFAKGPYIFPLRGVWWAGNGPTFYTQHRWALPEEFAFDIAKLGAGGLTHSGDGTKFTDYYAYGADVLAAGDGLVVAINNDTPEDPSAMQKPGESQADYFKRLLQEQSQRLSGGTGTVAGNYVMIDHGNSEYSLYAHLQQHSVRVHVGDRVKAGQVIGLLGSSGNSTEPHLHFQLCDRPDPLMCAGIPVDFTNVTIPWADLPRPVQSGDVLIAK
jgi:murein DD-endopeptidase MepM/ murein hydrolase activator NlpD